ncbi:MAG: hypothetical protein WAN36_03250 [Calditrichia bacterium]
MKKTELKMLNFRVPRNLINRLKRESTVRGMSQSAIVVSALERELIRWEKEYAQQIQLRKDAGFEGDEFDDNDNTTE